MTTAKSSQRENPEFSSSPDSKSADTLERLNEQLGGLNEEDIRKINVLHSSYHDELAVAERDIYNKLDNSTVRQQTLKGESLLDAKGRIAKAKARVMVDESMQKLVASRVMPEFAPDVSREDDRFYEVHSSIMDVITMPQEQWRGEIDDDGRRTGGIYEQTREKRKVPRSSSAEKETSEDFRILQYRDDQLALRYDTPGLEIDWEQQKYARVGPNYPLGASVAIVTTEDGRRIAVSGDTYHELPFEGMSDDYTLLKGTLEDDLSPAKIGEKWTLNGEELGELQSVDLMYKVATDSTNGELIDEDDPFRPVFTILEAYKNDSDSIDRLSPEKQLEGLAALKHKAFAAKVSGPAFGSGKRKELQDAYDHAEAAYLAALKLDYTQQLEAQFNDLDVNDPQQQQFIKELVEAQAKADRDAQYEELIARGGTRAKWMAKYAELGTMDKIGVGIAAGTAGVLVGMTAGLVGGAVAATAGAGVVGYRLVKGYTLHAASVYKRDDSSPEYTPDQESSVEHAAEYLKLLSQDKIKEAEQIKRRSVYWAVGTVAVGSAGAAVGGAWLHGKTFDGGNQEHRKFGLLEHFRWPAILDNNLDTPSSLSSGDQYSGEPTTKPLFSEGDTNEKVDERLATPLTGDALEAFLDDQNGRFGEFTEADPRAGEIPELLRPVETDVSLATPVGGEVPSPEVEITGRTIEEYIEQHAAGTEVPVGGTFYGTFSNLHIPEQYHAKLLQIVGPELENMNVAYPMGDLWGVSSAGELPEDAVRLIVETADTNGFIDIAGDQTEQSARSVETEYSAEAVEIGRGGGIIGEAADFGITDLNNEEVNELGKALVEEGTGYESTHLEENFGNKHGILYDADPNDAVKPGVFTEGAQNIFADFADDRELNDSILENQPTDIQPEDVIQPANSIDGAQETSTPRELEGISAETATAFGNDFRTAEETGNYALLNKYLPSIDFSQDLLQEIDDLGEQATFSDGSPIVSVPSGSLDADLRFMNGPNGETWPDSVQRLIARYTTRFFPAS